MTDTNVVAVKVAGPHQVRVTHADGVSAVHGFDPDHMGRHLAKLADPAAFATAQILDGTLGWIADGQVLTLSGDGLHFHALRECDPSCGRQELVTAFAEHECVELVRDVPELWLNAGDVGAVVHVYGGGGGYEVEFMDPAGRTIEVVTLDEAFIRLAEQD